MVDKADVYSVEEFLSEQDVSLIIPELQREFVWEAEHVNKLLDSIEFHRNDPALDYLFVGGMIVHQEPGSIRAGRRREFIPYWYDEYVSATHADPAYQAIIQNALIAKGHPAVYGPTTPDANFTAFKSLGEKVQLIDGQQRLTVLTILARVLEKHANISGTPCEPRLRSIYNHSFTGERITHTSPGCNVDYTLSLTHDPALNVGPDRGGPLSAINSVPRGVAWSTPDPEKDNLFCKSLEVIIQWLRQKIATNWAAAPAIEIQNFAEAVLEQVKIIPAAINASEQVHLVFRSSNAFGVKLTQGELIKNDVFYFATRAGIFAPVKTQWDAIHTALSSASLSNKRVTLDDFLFIYAQSIGITSRAKFSVNTLAKKHLHEAYNWWTNPLGRGQRGIYQIKFLIDEHTADSARLLRFVTDLKDTATAYAELMNRSLLEANTNAQIQKTIEGQIVLTDACKPYLLCLYRNLIYGKSARVKGRNTPILMNFLKPLSAILVYRYILRRQPIRYYRKAIYNLPKIFNAHRPRARKLTEIKERVEKDIFVDAALGPTPRLLTAAERTAIEDELEQKLLEPIYDNDLAKFILLDRDGIERCTRGGLFYTEYDANKYELEHILPKRAIRQWRDFDTRSESWYQEHILDGKLLFRDPVTNAGMDNFDIDGYVYKIGNMIIVEDKINGNYTQRLQGSGRRIRGIPGYRQYAADTEPAPMLLAKIQLNLVGKLHIYRYLPLDAATEGSMLLHVERFLNNYQGPPGARTGTPAPALVTTAGGLSASITGAGARLTDGAYNRVATSTSGSGVDAFLDIEVVGRVAIGATAIYHASGFQVGDTITVLGSDLGGLSPGGDVTITLTAGDLVDSTTGPYRWTPNDITLRTTGIAAWAKTNGNWKVW